MFRNLQKAALTLVISLISFSSFSQDYTFEDFVGTWHGTISSSYFGGYNDPMTMVIYSDGFYTETSGHLMPSIYPNTQQCEYQASTNRMHWWYLATVYSGQYFYDHFYYEVVYFNNDTLEMHYNFWDDPQPNPDAGTIFLVRENITPPPTNLTPDFIDGQVLLSWSEPDNGENPIAELQGYNVYERYDLGDYELLGFSMDTSYLIGDTTSAGLYAYYVTAVYDQGESLPSDELSIIYTTPEPESLQGNPMANNIALEWSGPNPGSGPMATLLGYNIYHKYENGSFGFVDFTEASNYIHENLNTGSHHYYVTAVYSGGESDPSDEIEVLLLISGLDEKSVGSARIFPNPASEFVYIHTEEEIRSIRIFNQSGQLLKTAKPSAFNQKVDISDINTGLYILQIETINGLISKKLMIR